MGGELAKAVKPARLFLSRQHLQARIDHLKALPETEDVVAILEAAMVSKAKAAALLPVFGHETAEKMSPRRRQIRTIHGLIIRRLLPNIDEVEKLNNTNYCCDEITDFAIYKLIVCLFKKYREGPWLTQSKMLYQPPEGEYSFDDLFWQLFRSGANSIVSTPTFYKLLKEDFPARWYRRAI
jgi:hypothetical protein